MEQLNRNRIQGGREGRSKGYDYELEVRDLINEHKDLGKTILKIKYPQINDLDLNKLKAMKLPIAAGLRGIQNPVNFTCILFTKEYIYDIFVAELRGIKPKQE